MGEGSADITESLPYRVLARGVEIRRAMRQQKRGATYGEQYQLALIEPTLRFLEQHKEECGEYGRYRVREFRKVLREAGVV